MKFNPYSLDQLCAAIIDNRGRTCPTADDGMPLIATNCIKNESLYPVFENIRYVDDITYRNWFRGHPDPDDIIFVCKGSPGRCCWVPDPVNFCIAQDMVAIRANRELVDPKFLFALLRSRDTQNSIQNMHVGTLIPHFKKGDFPNLYLNIPDNLVHQNKIGNIFFDFCQQASNLEAANKTLEAIAQAIFASWFVDFEPVKAKAAVLAAGGSFDEAERAAMRAIAPALDAATTALPDTTGSRTTSGQIDLRTLAAAFPSELVESELGLIPKGWKFKPLSSLAEFLNGVAGQKYPANDGEDSLPIVKISEMNNGITANTGRGSLQVPSKYIINDGDLLFSWSGTLKAMIWTKGRAILNQHLFKVTPEQHPLWFVHQWVNYHLERFQDIAKDKAVTMGHIKRSHLDEALCAIPDETTIIDAADCATGPISALSLNQSIQSQTLTALRDTLLPKLLSGELSPDKVPA